MQLSWPTDGVISTLSRHGTLLMMAGAMSLTPCALPRLDHRMEGRWTVALATCLVATLISSGVGCKAQNRRLTPVPFLPGCSEPSGIVTSAYEEFSTPSGTEG